MSERYLLFYGEVMYPRGGWDDFAGFYERLVDAVADGKEAATRRTGRWAHVADSETRSIVWSYNDGEMAP